MKCVALTGAAVLVSIGCASGMKPTASVFQPVPRDTKIAIIPLRDCTMPNNDDCSGSGNIATSVIAATLSEGRYQVIPLSRPANADQVVSDDSAVEVAKAKGFEYVINGEVNDFYRVAPMTFRVDRASLAFRVLRISDGSVVASAISSVEAGSNLSTPEGLIRKLAEQLLQEMSK